MGSSIICENVTMLPRDSLASWEDANRHMFCLRPIEETETHCTTDAASNLIHQSGTSGAVWAIGGALCKAKDWVEGMETEAETLRYVRKIFDIPVPEILYDWGEIVFSRPFLILKPIDGRTLQTSMAFALARPTQTCRSTSGSVLRSP